MTNCTAQHYSHHKVQVFPQGRTLHDASPLLHTCNKIILHLTRLSLLTLSNFLRFLKHNISETEFDSLIRHNRQGKVPAQLGPLEGASLIPLETCLREVRADGQCPKQQSCFL